MADLSLRFGAEENVSDTTKTISEALKKLAGALDDAGKEGKDAAEEVGKTEKATKSLGESVVVANQALELLSRGFELIKEPALAVAEYLAEGAKLAAEERRGFVALQAAIGPAADAISELTEEIERKTGADADALRSNAAWLASIGLTGSEIQRALPALQAYADVTGKDLSMAIRRLQGALEQGKLDEELRFLEGFLRSGAAQATSFAGELRRLDAGLENLQKGLGASVVDSDALKGSLEALIGFIETLTDRSGELGPLLGDVLASGLELSTYAGQAAVLVFQDLLASIGSVVGVAGLFGNKAAQDFADGIQHVLDRTKDLNPQLAELREKIAAVRAEAAEGNGSSGIALKDMDLGGLPEPFRRTKAGGKTDKDGPAVLGDSTIFDIPEMELEAKGREQVRAIAKGIRDEQAKKDHEAADLAREQAKDVAQAQKEVLAKELADKKAAESAGVSFGMSYLNALGQLIKGDGKGALRSAISGLATFLGFALGGPMGAQLGGGIGGLIGSSFRDGGVLSQVRIPKARAGIAIADLDADGMLLEGHKGEVMLTDAAVRKNGGIARVARQNDPLEPPMGGGGRTVINQYISAFTPRDAASAVAEVVAPGLRENLSNHQSGLLAAEMREAVADPRAE